MRLKLKISEKEARSLLKKGKLETGNIEVSLVRDVGRAVEKSEIRRRELEPTPDERKVMLHWNKKVGSGYEKKFGKNLPVEKRPTAQELNMVSKTIKVYGLETVLGLIDQYAEAILEKKHLSKNGRNYAYKNLWGFLKKCLESKDHPTALWWASDLSNMKMNDDNPDATRQVILLYGQHFLGKKNYEAETGRDYHSFVIFSNEIDAIQREYKVPMLRKNMILEAFKLLEERLTTVYPSNLSNKNYLKFDLKQWAKKLYG